MNPTIQVMRKDLYPMAEQGHAILFFYDLIEDLNKIQLALIWGK